MVVAFPTFEELLKKVKKPDLPDLTKPPQTEFDAEETSQFGYKLPSGWKLQRRDGHDTLLTPRGFKVRDFKTGLDGRVSDFKMFDADDNPVNIPQPDFVAEEQAGLDALAVTPRQESRKQYLRAYVRNELANDELFQALTPEEQNQRIDAYFGSEGLSLRQYFSEYTPTPPLRPDDTSEYDIPPFDLKPRITEPPWVEERSPQKFEYPFKKEPIHPEPKLTEQEMSPGMGFPPVPIETNITPEGIQKFREGISPSGSFAPQYPPLAPMPTNKDIDNIIRKIFPAGATSEHAMPYSASPRQRTRIQELLNELNQYPSDFVEEEQAGLTALGGTQRFQPSGIAAFRQGQGPPGAPQPFTIPSPQVPTYPTRTKPSATTRIAESFAKEREAVSGAIQGIPEALKGFGAASLESIKERGRQAQTFAELLNPFLTQAPGTQTPQQQVAFGEFLVTRTKEELGALRKLIPIPESEEQRQEWEQNPINALLMASGPMGAFRGLFEGVPGAIAAARVGAAETRAGAGTAVRGVGKAAKQIAEISAADQRGMIGRRSLGTEKLIKGTDVATEDLEKIKALNPDYRKPIIDRWQDDLNNAEQVSSEARVMWEMANEELMKNPAGEYIKYIQRSGNLKGELDTITKAQYTKITGRTPPTSIVNKQGKIPFEYALDYKADEIYPNAERIYNKPAVDVLHDEILAYKQESQRVKDLLDMSQDAAEEARLVRGRIQYVTGEGGMAPGTSVQSGMGIGEKPQSASMLGEFKDIGKKQTLIDQEAIKAKEVAKPLPGQIGMEGISKEEYVKQGLVKYRKEAKESGLVIDETFQKKALSREWEQKQAPLAQAAPPVREGVDEAVESAIREAKPPAAESATAKPAPTTTGSGVAPQGVARLPRELSGAKSRYNIGTQSWTPQFESDIDKALYTVGQTTPNKRHDDYMGWLRQQLPGKSDVEIQAMGKQVRASIKGIVRGQPEGPINIPSSGIGKADFTPAPEPVPPQRVAQGEAVIQPPNLLSQAESIANRYGKSLDMADEAIAKQELGDLSQDFLFYLDRKLSGKTVSSEEQFGWIRAAKELEENAPPLRPEGEPWAYSISENRAQELVVNRQFAPVSKEELQSALRSVMTTEEAAEYVRITNLKRTPTFEELARFQDVYDRMAAKTGWKQSAPDFEWYKPTAAAAPQPGAGAIPPVKPPATAITSPPGGTPPRTGTTTKPSGQSPPPDSPLGTIEGMWAKGRGHKKGVSPDFYLKAQEYGNDIFYGIRQMQARVAKGQSITPGGKDDIVTLLTRAPGAANAGATRYILAVDEIKRVAPKALADDINTIIYANHAKEVLAEKGANRIMAGGFRNAADLDDALAQLQLKLGTDEFKRTEQAAEIVKNIYATERQRLTDAGLITQELADELAQKYPWYNPLHYVDDVEELAAQGKSVKPFNVISSGLRRLTEEGTAKAAIAPLNLLGDQLIRNEVRIVKNDTAKAIIQMALQDKKLAGQVVKLSGIKPVASVEGQTVFRRTYQDIPGTLSFFENGTRQIYQVPDFIYREANVLTQTISNPVSSIVGAMNGVSRAAFTSASPPFVVSNMLNDMLTAFVSRGIMPQETVARLIQSLRGLENDKVMQAFRLAGGYQQRFYGRAAETLAKEVGVTGGKIIKGPNFFKKAWRSLPAAGEAGEQAPRTALFKRQLGKTLPNWRNMTPEQIAATPQGRKAAAEAVELTINFGRGGYAIKAANPFVIFLNASMEGTKLPFRALRDNPAARWRLAGVGAGVAGLAGYNLSYPEYMDIPNYIRWGSVVVMLPSKEKNPDGTNKPNYAAIIPRTREWGAFLGPLTYGMERLYADAPAEFGQFSATMAPMLSPIAEVPLPQVISELVQQQANWDFYRSRPIVSQSLQNLPKEEQTTPFVSRTVEAGAQAVGVSPIRAQHAVSGIFGGAAGAATSVTDYIADLLKPEIPSPEIAALAEKYKSLPIEKGTKDTITQEDFLKRMNASDKRKMLNYLNERPQGLPIASSITRRILPGRGGQLAENLFELEKSVDILPSYFKDNMTSEEMKRVDTKLWTEKKAQDAKILQQYDLAMINKPSAAREKYLTDNPDVNATALLWGKTTTIHSLEAAEKLMAEAEKYGITPELIPAFSLNEKGQERFPRDKTLWNPYLDYGALPGTSYLNMTQNQVDAGLLPGKYRKQWGEYQQLKSDFAKSQFKKSAANKEVAKSDWREDLRRKDERLDKWLIENKGLKPLAQTAPKAAPKTARPKLRRR